MYLVPSVIVFAVLPAAIWRLLSRLYLHSLAQYPGPKLAAISNIPYVYWVVSGQLHRKLRDLHDQYGEVVRIRPNALTYRSPQAWKDIYGHRTQGRLPFSKDPEFFIPLLPGKSHLINATEADHTRQKRLLSHAFSERALQGQEALIMSYIDLFVDRLRGFAQSGRPVRFDNWFNFLTFDIVGDLAFGEPFGCLRQSEYNPWVAMIFHSLKSGAYLRALSVYPRLSKVLRALLPRRLMRKRVAYYQMGREKTLRRLALGRTDRPDFISYVLRHNADDDRAMQPGEIQANAPIIISAGSETTATVLAAALYYLLRHPDWHRRAVAEVRAVFPDDADITFVAVQDLPVLDAVIQETLRLFPPVPGILPRVVPPGGALIDGSFVAEGVSVSVAQYSTFRSVSNFIDPDSFRPERWLDDRHRSGDEAIYFKGDRHEALQPFSYGPRACIGRNLAYAEMRTVLAKLFWNFDMSMVPGGEDWEQARSYIVWEKPALRVELTERVR